MQKLAARCLKSLFVLKMTKKEDVREKNAQIFVKILLIAIA